jgi:hypothetical protein
MVKGYLAGTRKEHNRQSREDEVDKKKSGPESPDEGRAHTKKNLGNGHTSSQKSSNSSRSTHSDDDEQSDDGGPPAVNEAPPRPPLPQKSQRNDPDPTPAR